MDQTEHKTQIQVTKSQFLKKITKLLLSVSVFSFLLSNSSTLSFLHSFNFYFSTIPFQLFSHTIDKNCMFLLCNGLLVFVAKYSGLISVSKHNPSSVVESLSSESESKVPLLEKEVLEERTEAQEKAAVADERRENEYTIGKAEEGGEIKEFIVEEEEEQENGFLITGGKGEVFVQEDDQGEVKELDNGLPIQEEEEADDQGNGVLSTEELNQKFEEFIRKMKEEIRIEAQQQQQLVIVN